MGRTDLGCCLIPKKEYLQQAMCNKAQIHLCCLIPKKEYLQQVFICNFIYFKTLYNESYFNFFAKYIFFI